MILVAPSIPAYRRHPLEEFGVRCVKVSHGQASVRGTSGSCQRCRGSKEDANVRCRVWLLALSSVSQRRWKIFFLQPRLRLLPFPICCSEMAFPSLKRCFPEYEVRPVRMTSPHSHDIFCFPEKAEGARFIRGGAWWAYRFGHCDEMPKNDVPNVSMAALPWGLDFAINAELRHLTGSDGQKIEESLERFNGLVREHGGLEWQAWLKLEHQPRFYHWVEVRHSPPGTWDGRDLLELYRQSDSTSPSCGISG